ncbi:helix-turn-helix transcriptional regulator [Candidatus Protofrankia datiscae]|nr:LuxR C-terminal-related transcriptional regulator [Candidatus Protofrankia datiscae]
MKSSCDAPATSNVSGRATDLFERAVRLLGVEPERGRADAVDAADALSAACAERLLSGAPDAESTAALARLVCDLQDLAVEQAETRMASRARRIARCERGLSLLRTVISSKALEDRVCEEIAANCGFARVLLSRVEDGVWRPWKVNKMIRDEPWFAAWVQREILLDDLVLEAELLSERRPGLVTNTADPRVHPIIRAGEATSYVVAPITPAGRVVGFLHADHGSGGHTCDETDRDVLWAFSEGFGHLYERSVLVERLRLQRDRVRQTLAVVGAALEELTEAEIELVTAPDDDTPVARTASSVFRSEGGLDELTAREREVLALIAGGASNQEIAEQLVITVGTVKTHVKHILAKLGAVNRSQAIAAYHGVVQD